MKVNDKNIYILVILSILLFLITIIGTSYAYFSYRIKGDDTLKPITIKSAEIYVEYKKYNDIQANNIYPGWEDSLDFSITNSTNGNDIPATY